MNLSIICVKMVARIGPNYARARLLQVLVYRSKPENRSNVMKICVHGAMRPMRSSDSQPGEPLWRIVPTRDEHGHLLTDFMMLIPRLKEKSAREVERTVDHIRTILTLHSEVVFADLNLAINLLWVSLRPKRGAMAEIAAAIRLLVPEAVLVGNQGHAHY